MPSPPAHYLRSLVLFAACLALFLSGEQLFAADGREANQAPLPAASPGREAGSVVNTEPGEKPDSGQPQEPQPEQEQKPEPDTLMDTVHAEISRRIQGTAAWMDSFFGDWRYASELNESYIRLRYNVFLEEGSPMVREPDLQVRLILPQLKQRTRLVLTGTPGREREFSALTANTETEHITSSEERNVSATVQQTFLETAKQNFFVRAGAKVHDYRPVVVLGPRYRVLFFREDWVYRFTQEALWTSNVGWDARAIADMERPLPHNLFFRGTNEWVWIEDTPGVLYAFSFILGQPLNHRRAVHYEWANIFHTRPVHQLTEVALRVRYRQRIWRDWLYLELAPQYRFPRDQSFKGLPGLLFRLDLFFGDYSSSG